MKLAFQYCLSNVLSCFLLFGTAVCFGVTNEVSSCGSCSDNKRSYFILSYLAPPGPSIRSATGALIEYKDNEDLESALTWCCVVVS